MKPTIPILVGLLSAALFVPAQAQDGPPPGGDGPPHGPHGGYGGGGFQGGPHRGGGMMRSKGRLMHLWRGIDELNGKNAISKTQAQKIVALVLPISKKSTLSDAEAKSLGDNLEALLTSTQKTAVFSHGPGGPDGMGGGPGGMGGGPGGMGGGPGGMGGGPGGMGGGPGGMGGGPGGMGGGPGGMGGGPGGMGGPGGPGRGPGGHDGQGRPDGPPPGDDRDGGRPDGPRGDRDGHNRGEWGKDRGDQGRRPDFDKMRAAMQNINPFYPPTGYAEWKNWPEPMQQDMARHYRENRATLESLSKQAKSKK